MADSEQPRLVRKPHCKSVIWNYFADENDIPIKEKEDNPVCLTCKKTMLAKGENTSNMLTHLQAHHVELHAEAQPTSLQSHRQPTITETFD